MALFGLGKKKSRFRSAVDTDGVTRVFSREFFHEEIGCVLQKAGTAQDMPRNFREPIDLKLNDEKAELQSLLDHVNGTMTIKVAAFDLLPAALWRSRHQQFLVETIGMMPYRPWTTIFLPLTQQGADEFQIPLFPHDLKDDTLDDVLQYVDEIRNIFSGADDETARALSMTLGFVRNNHPECFPPDQQAFPEPILVARANLRALAFSNGSIQLGTDVVIRAHQTFLGAPDLQLVA